jgi:1-aminocyclopropane-1-carboxylate deaminase
MLSDFPHYPLTFGPTPIEHLPRFTAQFDGAVEIYAKREDCNSGLAFGGNKRPKLEDIVPDAIASNADTLVSIGGVQSNHTRMIERRIIGDAVEWHHRTQIKSVLRKIAA